jgi:hypothetical protein
MKKIGRNDPCPCGSGKKYKKCCMSSAQEASDELQESMQTQEFQSLEEAQDFANQFMHQRNQAPLEEFSGLSPEQMYKILNFPFESPDTVYFPESAYVNPDQSSLFSLFQMIANAVGEKGLKATLKGNLPQKFCRESAVKYWGEKLHAEKTRFGGINKEEDFSEMHVARIIAEMSGFLTKRKNKFFLTKKYRETSKKQPRSIFPSLFMTYVKEFNWAYWDRYQEVQFIQQSFVFSLYLLSRYGNKQRSEKFYEDRFLDAFPETVKEFKETNYSTPAEDLRHCFSFRVIRHFLAFMGLANLEAEKTDKPFHKNYKLVKTPLLDEIVKLPLSNNRLSDSFL